MSRPFMQHGIGRLEELFAKSKGDQVVLGQLEHELQHRQVPRAVALLAEVKAAINERQTSTPAVVAPAPKPTGAQVATSQFVLWDGPVQLPTEVAAPTSTAPSEGLPRSSLGLEHTNRAKPTLALDDAYKLLKATPSSTWEAIEQTRRLLVQASHPARLAALPADKRRQALADARRVNEACAVVSLAQRTGR